MNTEANQIQEVKIDSLKFKIAKLIAGGTHYSEHADYQELIEAIYDNKYRTIDKCPINLYILGIVESFIIKDLEHANRILNVVKEVTKEILEVPGIELDYKDKDWDNLKLIVNSRYNPKISWSGGSYELVRIDKIYMSEFFEN